MEITYSIGSGINKQGESNAISLLSPFYKNNINKVYILLKLLYNGKDKKREKEGKCMENDEKCVKIAENDEIEGIEVNCEEPTNEKMDDSSTEIVIENDNNEILRRILANRLTDEEKELIRIFGGKI